MYMAFIRTDQLSKMSCGVMFLQRRTLTLFKRNIDSNIQVVSNKNVKKGMCYEIHCQYKSIFFLTNLNHVVKSLLWPFTLEQRKPRNILGQPRTFTQRLCPKHQEILNGLRALKPHLLLASCRSPFPFCNFNFLCVEWT